MAMGPDEPKGEVPPREAAEQEETSIRHGARKEGAMPTEDEREEEGYSQPESSAQKGVERPRKG